MASKKTFLPAIFGLIVLTGLASTWSNDRLKPNKPENKPVASQNVVLNGGAAPSASSQTIKSSQQAKLLVPVDWGGVGPLLDSLKDFGEKFTAPADVLSKNPTFVRQDLEIMRRTKQLYGNPINFQLGEQCGLPGGVFAYPPGKDSFKTACGGTPAFSGIPSGSLSTVSGAIQGKIVDVLQGSDLGLTNGEVQNIASELSGGIASDFASLALGGGALNVNSIISGLTGSLTSELSSALSGVLQDTISSLAGDILGSIAGDLLDFGGLFGGGSSCNTDSRCMFTGKCFYVPLIGCTVKSCYGACGGGGGLSLSSLGSGLISGLGSSLLGGVSSGILSGLGGDLLSGLGSSAISSLGSGILSGLGSNLTSGLASGLLNGLGSNVLDGLTGSLGNALGSSILQQLGGSAIQSIASQLGVNLSQGTISQISGIIQQVAGGNLSNLSSSQLLSLGKQIGGTILKNGGSGAISGAAKQAGSGLAGQLGQQALSSTISNVVGSGGGGGGISYLWDSVTHTCGCGAIGSGEGGGTAGGGSNNEPPATLDNGLTVDSNGNATNSVAGVEFSGEYDPNGTTIMFDNSMTQAEKDAWIANNPNALANAPPGSVIYVAPKGDFDTISTFEGNPTTVDAFNCTTCTNDSGAPTDGIFINSSLTGSAADNGYPSSFSDISYSDMTLLHEFGHQEINGAGLNNDSFLQGEFTQYNNIISSGGEPFTTDSGTSFQYENSNEFSADVYALYKGSNGTYQPSDPASAKIYNDTVNYMKSKGILP